HRRALDIDLLAIGQPCVDDVQADLRAGAECGARGGLESIVSGQNDHSGLESGSDGAAATHGSDLAQTQTWRVDRGITARPAAAERRQRSLSWKTPTRCFAPAPLWAA